MGISKIYYHELEFDQEKNKILIDISSFENIDGDGIILPTFKPKGDIVEDMASSVRYYADSHEESNDLMLVVVKVNDGEYGILLSNNAGLDIPYKIVSDNDFETVIEESFISAN